MVVIVRSYEYVEYDGLLEWEPLLEVNVLLSWAPIFTNPHSISVYSILRIAFGFIMCFSG